MKRNRFLILALIFGILFNLYRSAGLFQFEKLNRDFDAKKYEKLFNQSQWVVPNSDKPVGDDIVYAYSGARYILGTSPEMINPEHPPLIKNLIGLSAVYLNNEYYPGLVFGLFAAISFYLLSNLVLKNKLLSLLISIFLFLEPLIVVNYFSTLLDLPTLGFLNLYLYFLIKYMKNKKYKNIYFSGIFLGLIISSKFFGLALPIVMATILYFVITKNYRAIFHYGASLCVAALILTANYFQFFIQGKNFIDFLKVQKYIYVFHTEGRQEATFINPSFFMLFFQGKFYSEIDRIATEAHHSYFWAVGLLISVLNIFIRGLASPIVTWIIIYSLFQIFSLTNARYLIILLPYIYLTGVAIIKK